MPREPALSLTEAAVFFRKFFRVMLVGLLALVALWAMWGYIVAGIRVIFPVEDTPTVKFGKIAPPKLPANKATNLSFVLDTATGDLPILTKVLPVYRFITPEPNVLDSDRAAKLAANFGFSGPQQIDAVTFRYLDPNHPTQEIGINIVSKNFVILTNDFSHPTILKTPPEGTSEQVIEAARNVLDLRNLLAIDLEGSKTSIRYLKISGNSLAPANSISESNFARVDIFRKNINNYPILTPGYSDGLIHLVLAGTRTEPTKVVEASYIYWPYDASSSSTYPIRSSASAWEELRLGQGSLVTPSSPNFTEARIKNISLAYFEAKEFQPYMQPIYLFKGVGLAQDGSEVEVVLYLPAVDPGYLSE
jgi:hypothetical protein